MTTGGEQAFAMGPDRPPVRGLLFFAIVAILAVTLTPAKEWEGAKDHVLCVFCEGFLPNALDNLVLFLPLGITMRLCGYPMARTCLVGTLLSCGIEVTQSAISGRTPNLGDFLFNVCGTVLGSALSRTALGPAVESVLSRCVRVLTRPEPSLADHLALAAALMATAMFGHTGILLASAFTRGTYFGGIDTNVLQITSTPLRLGGNTYLKDYFQGLIDNVRIYNRPLTTSEIQADMHLPVPASGPTPSPAADLVAAYSFDEGMGTTVGPTPQARTTSALFLPQPGRRQANSGMRWPSTASRMW